MRKSLSVITLSAMLFAVLFAGCNSLSKMKSGCNKVRYQANPNPVETMDEKVVVKFTGQIPPKYFKKNCAIFLQPVFSWDLGEVYLEPLTLKGEKVEGDGTIINYDKGGRFTYTDMFDFKPGMETGRLTLTPIGYKGDRTNEDARFMEDILHTNEGVAFNTVILSDGVNNTSSWVDIKGNISIAPINYNKSQGIVETADIYFLNGTSELDWNFEMNRKFDCYNTFLNLKRIMLEQGLPKQIAITGWASPEGEETNNVGVSKNRADLATAQLNKLLDEVLTTMAKRAKVKPQDVEYYKYQQLKKLIITTRAAGEDWVHFVVMVEGSDIQDKHAIINIVETQQNVLKREQMIRNMAETYEELKDEIFPNLRRAQIALYYSEARRTDPELAKLASLQPAKLSFDELMYAAYINYNYDTKLKYYKWATENHSQEWAAWNNAGAVAFYLDSIDEAERYLNVARDMNPHNPDVLNNTGLLYLAKKDYALAKYYFNEAIRQGSTDATANIPILNLKQGNYTEAKKALKNSSCTYNLAFTQLMNDEVGAALQTLNCCLDQNADVKYLRAVCYARRGDRNECLKALKASIDDKYDYKRKAAVDTEFKEYWNDEEFKLIIKLW